MLEKILKVGDKIELKSIYQLRRTSNETEQKSYASQVLDIIDDYKLSIAVPIENGHLIPLEVGSKYELSFMTVSGMYLCKCEVKGRFRQNNLFFLSIDIISELKKDQRRQYFRFEKIIPMKCRYVTEEEKKVIVRLDRNMYQDEREKRDLMEKADEFEKTNIDGTIINISGGGLKFSFSQELKKNDMVAVDFKLDENIEITAFAKVLEDGAKIQNTQLFEHRMEFVRITKENREKIIRYVFDAERKQRQRSSKLK